MPVGAERAIEQRLHRRGIGLVDGNVVQDRVQSGRFARGRAL